MLSYPKVLKESIIETGLDRHQELTLELCRRKVMQKLLQNQHADKTEWKDEKYGVPHYARIYSTNFQETVCNFEDDNWTRPQKTLTGYLVFRDSKAT